MSGYTAKEEDYLCNYIAEARPNETGRQGNTIYRALVENLDKWPWAKTHSWQGWRERYRTHKEEFDRKIRKIQKARGIDPNNVEQTPPQPSQRAVFTDTEDKLLVKYLARYNPQLRGRNGNDVYKRLVQNEDGKWNWSRTHSWHSWRHRYVSRQDSFDRKIGRYIERHNIPIPETPRPIARDRDSGRPVKRQRIDELDAQEEQLANLVLSTPGLQDDTPRGSRIKEEPTVKEPAVKMESIKREPSPGVVQANGARSAITPETVKAEDDDSSDDSEEDDENRLPPGSEDYDGEIFEDAEEDKAENSVVPQQRDVNGDDGDDENLDIDPDLVIPSKRRTDSPQHVQESANDQSKISIPVTEEDGALRSPPKSSPLKPPVKSRPRINHNTFTLASQSRRRVDDPFEDSPPPPAKQERTLPIAQKHLPAYKEGPYGNRLNGTRSKKADESSTEDSDTEVGNAKTTWPPMRKRMKALEAPQESEVKGGNEADVKPQAAEKRRREKGKAKANEGALDREAEPQEIVQNTTEISSFLPEEVLGPTKPRTLNQNGFAQNIPEPGPSRITPLKRRKTDIFAPTPRSVRSSALKCHSTGSTPDPNTTNDVTSLITSRPSTRTINLRHELANRSLNQPIRRPSSRASYASHTSGISEEDVLTLQEMGIQMAVQKLSQEFGFTEAVVHKLWNDLKSLRLLREVLTDMKEGAERSMSDWIERASVRLSKSVSRSPTTSKREPMPVVRYISLSARPSIEPPSAHGSSTSAKRHRRRSRSSTGHPGSRSLEITPVDPRDASAAMEVGYEPLTGTRAGKYTRLVKLGREDEALKREQRRVSNVAYSPRRGEKQHEADFRERQVVEGEADDGGDAEAEVEDEVEIEIWDEEDEDEDQNEEQDEEMLDVQDGDDAIEEAPREAHPDVSEDHDMDVDSPPEQPPSNHNRQQKQERERDEDDGEEHQHNQTQENEVQDDRERSDDELEDEELISIKSGSPGDEGEVEALVQTRSDAERWKEVEHRFLAANRQIVKELRDIEKDFNPSFMMKWIGAQVSVI
ncbi:hypothetical protein D9756_008879 [Leucocoprinus leucothites]|uniref:TERF2-interacting telomeric protein 1 Myb domain-containing protein n=1 Tax=Leucocoprinus leucothites TaxID=201217 RepID=A0A8H5FUZ0_9AGAR|nr:hypothetical protein D9756_008879 [Leucoagaricus leucothites]